MTFIELSKLAQSGKLTIRRTLIERTSKFGKDRKDYRYIAMYDDTIKQISQKDYVRLRSFGAKEV